MEYLNTTWKFTPFEGNNSFTFYINKKDNEFTMDISIIKDDIEENITNIPLQVSPNHVYRSEEIPIKQEICYKTYIVNSVKFMLKFRNDQLLPVSTIFLFCEKNDKKRIFNMTILDAIELGYNISER